MESKNTPLNSNSRLDAFENIDNWQKISIECVVCHRFSLKYHCQISDNWVCLDCAAEEFKNTVKAVDISNYDFKTIRKFMGAKKNLRWRFFFLHRFNEIYQREDEKNYYAMKVMLVQHLGYIVQHPLSWHIRLLAYDTCLQLREGIIPFLDKLYQKRPWQFQINVTKLIARINPANGKFQFMVNEALDNSNKEVRRHLVELLGEIDQHRFPWVTSKLFQLSLDKDQKVREMAKKYLPKTATRQRLQKEALANQLPQEIVGKTLLDLYEEFRKQQTAHQRLIEESVNELYTAACLKRIINRYLTPIFKEQNLISTDVSINKLKKKQLTTIFTHFILDEKLFRLCYSRLTQGMKKLIEKLVWERDAYSIEEIEKIIGKKAFSLSGKIVYYDIEKYLIDEFLLFQSIIDYDYWDNSYSGFVYLHPQIRAIFKKYLPFPQEGIIRTASKIPKNLLTYFDDNNFAQHANLFREYLKQGNVQYSKTNRNVLKASLKKFVKYFSIKEFYPNNDKYLEFLFSNLIINFLRQLEPNSPNPQTANDVKELLLDYFNNEKFGNFFELSLLDHIRGDFYLYKVLTKHLREMLLKILKEISQFGWLSISNVLTNVVCREEEFNLLPFKQNLDFLYINLPNEHAYSFYTKTHISIEMFHDVFFAPLVKAMFFLFAALGLVDIAYDLPSNNKYQQKNRNYLSPFEGLKFIRISRFGKYVLGFTDEFEIKQDDEPAHIILDDKRLIVTVEGSGLIERLILSQMAESATKNRYKITYKSFLQNCQTVSAIRKNIKTFKENICSDLPEIWQQFFHEIEEKINPLQERNDLRIFKITPNGELMSLIANDKILRKYILKMENFHISIAEKNVRKVVERLREFGFFVDNL